VPRPRPADRFGQLVAAAVRIFIVEGYGRTQMQDVADVLGVAKGTVYGYVESKAALLAAALRFADGVEPLPAVEDLPVRTPADRELAALVAERLHRETAQLRLVQALARPSIGAVGEELTAIIIDLYQKLARHRVSIKLVDRCAAELPELAEVWFGQGRAGQVAAFTEYLQRHADRGTLRLPGPAPLIARTIVETCVLWAVHLHWDPAGDQPHTNPDTIATTLAGLLTHGVAPAPTRPKGKQR
jgi:AcrR family transcriptional regulator